MKIYELKMQDGGKGIFKVSVVKDPAIESTLIKFSKETEEVLTFNDEEKRIIYSVAMRPNKLIFRKDVNGEPAQVYYTKETVEQAQINYFRNHGNLTTNINHSEDSNAMGIFPFESWVVENPENDKSKEIGLHTKEGDWVMAYKVDNNEIWTDYIKTGKLDGLSIEATNMEHIFKNEIKMTQTKEKTFYQKVKEIFATEEEEKVVEEVAAVEEVVEEEKPEEEMAEVVTEVVEPTEKEQLLMDEIISLKQTVAELQAEKVKENTELETMKSDFEELKKTTAAAKPIVNAPSVEKHTVEKKYSEMNNREKTYFNRHN